jgi:hypothetical protein
VLQKEFCKRSNSPLTAAALNLANGLTGWQMRRSVTESSWSLGVQEHICAAKGILQVVKQPVNHGRPEFCKRPDGLTDETLCD